MLVSMYQKLSRIRSPALPMERSLNGAVRNERKEREGVGLNMVLVFKDSISKDGDRKTIVRSNLD